ncbi:Uncharacterised protein g7870 [Pycnogonum litorale]
MIIITTTSLLLLLHQVGSQETKPTVSTERPKEVTVEPDGNEPVKIPNKSTAIKVTDGDGMSSTFGEFSALSWHSWTNVISSRPSALNWNVGTGRTHIVYGGPPIDDTSKDDKGGYAFVDMSENVVWRNGIVLDEAILESPLLDSTVSDDVAEVCVSFSYLISDSGSIAIYVKDDRTNITTEMWKEITPNDGKKWNTGCFVYTHDDKHKLIVKGMKNSPLRTGSQQGCRYLAVDNINLSKISEKNCKGHCTFGHDFCSWTNAKDEDDFDWKLARSSEYSDTGPTKDHSNFGKHAQIGAYAYISSDHPRQREDIARLISPVFKASESPVCMQFYTNMFGANDAELRVLINTGDDNTELWKMPNVSDRKQWIFSQLQVSEAQDFKIVIEGKVATQWRGIIGIDDIAINPGPCIVHPDLAGSLKGPCDFEKPSICGWRQEQTSVKHEWIRRPPQLGRVPEYDHSNKNFTGHFMRVQGGGYSFSSLFSPEIIPSVSPCISLAFIMWKEFAEQSGPTLGMLKIYSVTGSGNNVTRTLLWQLRGHQGEKWMKGTTPVVAEDNRPPRVPYKIEIEEESYMPSTGLSTNNAVIAVDDIYIYDAKCERYPASVMTIPGECDFQRDLCGWKVLESKTGDEKRQYTQSQGEWTLAKFGSTSEHLDRTYRNHQGGYVFFHVYNNNPETKVKFPRMTSPTIPKTANDRDICMTFSYRATVPTAKNIALSVKLLTLKDDGQTEKEQELWKDDSQMENSWKYGQLPVKLPVDKLSKLMLEGSAADAGYAVDDIIFLRGTCKYKPHYAKESLKKKTNPAP